MRTVTARSDREDILFKRKQAELKYSSAVTGRQRAGSRFYRLGFRFVSLILLVTLVPGAIISTVLIKTSSDSIRQAALNNNLSQARLVADMTTGYIGELQAQIRVFATRPDVRQAVLSDSIEHLQFAVSQLAQIQASLDSIGICDANGILRATSVLNAIGFDNSNANWFQQVMASDDPFLGESITSSITGRKVLPYAVPILDNVGEAQGVIVEAICLQALSQTLLHVNTGVGTNAYIVDFQNVPLTIASSTSGNTLNLYDQNTVISSLMSQQNGAVEINNNGESHLVGFSPVANLPWGVIVSTPRETALGLVPTLVSNGILYTSLIVVVALILGQFLVMGVIRPLRRLLVASSAIGKGNLDYPVDTQSHGEVGELSRAISAMAQSLKTTLVSRDKLLIEIDKRHKAEEKLSDLSRHLEYILGTVPDIITELDIKGVFIWANSEAKKFFGQDMVGKQPADYLAEQSKSSYVTAPYISDPQTGTEYSEIWQVRRDGQSRLLAEWRRAITNELGDTIGYLSASQDITEQHKAEQENQQLRNKTELLSRLATLGEMAAGVAHEINNPLTAIIGYSELLASETDVPDSVKQDLNRINEGSQRVKAIVKRMLTFARQNKPVQTIVNINELIENTISMREYILKTANITVVRNFDAELPSLKADSGQLQQVFLNIIINAEQAMKTANKGGTLTVSSQHVDNIVRIVFKDDGPGMGGEVKAKLFEPFFTTKAPGEGTGLGLSLSHSIIIEHGGTIDIESELGTGASFIIQLPVN